MIFPFHLQYGDTIGIVQSSNPITEDILPQFNRGIDKIRNLEFKIYQSKKMDKTQQLHDMFTNSRVKAIISAQGGDLCNTIIPSLDYNCIRNNPKIIIGFSDFSVLLNAITQQTNLVTYLGPDVTWGFGSNYSQYTGQEFVKILVDNNRSITNNSTWEILKISKSKPFKGKSWGGDIRCFLKLLGTKYFPNLRGSILLIESVKQNAYWFESIFEQLKQIGALNNVNGIILGANYKCEEFDESIEDILIRKTKGIDINILKINEFGHHTPHSVFPIGAMLNYDTFSNQLSWE